MGQLTLRRRIKLLVPTMSIAHAHEPDTKSVEITRPILTIQNYQRDALNIIYSSNIITLLYMLRVSSTHLQEDIVVHKQHMVPPLSIRILVSC